MLMRRIPQFGSTPQAIRRQVAQKRSLRILLCLELVLSDSLALTIAFVTSRIARGDAWTPLETLYPGAIAGLLYVAFAVCGGAFKSDILSNGGEGIRRACRGLCLSLLVTIAVMTVSANIGIVSTIHIALAGAFAFTLMCIGRLTMACYARSCLGTNMFGTLYVTDWPSPVNDVSDACLDQCDLVLTTHQMFEWLSQDDPRAMSIAVGIFATFERVVVDCTPDKMPYWARVLKGASVDGEIIYRDISPLGAVGTGVFCGNPTLLVARRPFDMPERLRKRLFDLMVVIPVLIGLMIPMAIVAVVMKLAAPRQPVIIARQIVGRGNMTVRIHSFRLAKRSDHDGITAKATLTEVFSLRLSDVLRYSGMDKSLQLFNILSGEMSFVGPRTDMSDDAKGDIFPADAVYRDIIRRCLKPGLVFPNASSETFQPDEASDQLARQLQLEFEYLRDWRIWRDVSVVVSALHSSSSPRR